MATLTTSWQSLGSASLGSSITIHLDGRYTSQSVGGNTTNVEFRLRSVGNSWRTTSGTAKFTGAYTDSASCATYPNYITSGSIVYSISKTVQHNTDGSKTLSIGGSVTANLGTVYTANISNKSVTIPKIDRLATITSATDFTDEGNPTITFNNPAGFTVKPYINFYDNNNNLVYQLYRDISALSPYNWTITSTERTAMRQATNQQTTYRAQVGVDTYNGATKLGYNSVAKTMTYVNANPTQTITTTETNQKIVTLLGTNTANTIIQNTSNLTFSVTPTALKNATISKVELNGVPDTTSPYEFTNIVPITNNFVVKTTDSRTLSVENTITKTMINYEPIDVLSVSFKRYTPTSSDVILNAEIKYKQATFGNTTNIPTIKWKIGEDGQENTLSSSDYTIDVQNNRIIISDLTLTDVIPYNNNATFYLLVQDLLTSDSDADDVGRGIPTFEAGEHDFQVNGDLYIADTNRENAINVKSKLDWLSTQNILWQGVMYMNASQTVYYPSLSNQPNGIVLVWSSYENGQPNDWDWVCHFVPKQFPNVNIGGGGINFNMNTVSYGHVGSKYLYIRDDYMSGHANNEAYSTGSGIDYDNRYWVLRYVIGV